MTQFGSILDIFEDFSILAEKQRLKPRKSNSLMNFASLDTQLDPQLARLVEWNESGVKKPSVHMTHPVYCATHNQIFSLLGLFHIHFCQCHSFVTSLFRYICIIHPKIVFRLGSNAAQVSKQKHVNRNFFVYQVKSKNIDAKSHFSVLGIL